MVKLISYPFRLDSKGSVVTLDEGEDYYGDELAMLIKTVPGERELVAEYGIEDPTFDTVSEVELIEKVSLFGPPVIIGSIDIAHTSEEKVQVNITYSEDLSDVDVMGQEEYSTDETYDLDENYDYDDALFDFDFTESTDV